MSGDTGRRDCAHALYAHVDMSIHHTKLQPKHMLLVLCCICMQRRESRIGEMVTGAHIARVVLYMHAET